ncbi:energy-coupling factor ABC transporter ATP-binding protein [Ampullimonas aquatilis]|uniref:energy-coupling factor ABC transporter ATP-binding protein n=1 Tax=Ampullimonas aquatilis TaxID=1341549 RepID=UPI003C77D3FC
MIELSNVSFAWPDGLAVLDNVSLSVRAGERLVLLGANGCGKSSLLKLFNGLIFAQTGHYAYCGTTVTRLKTRERDWGNQFRREMVLLFQQPEAMLFNPTVQDEIAYGPLQLGWSDVTARVARWAQLLGLSALLDKAPFQLSGGQKQKVALASILVLEPEVLLLDEPTAHLDPASAGWLIDYLISCNKTVIISTHQLSMAAELGDRCLVMGEGGQLLYDGAVQTALNDMSLLQKAGLMHRHYHTHKSIHDSHSHTHD